MLRQLVIWGEVEVPPFDIRSYIDLITDFVGGRLSAGEFESRYLTKFTNDPSDDIGETFLILDRLFADVDEYNENPELRGVHGIDEFTLRERSKTALDQLKLLEKKGNG